MVRLKEIKQSLKRELTVSGHFILLFLLAMFIFAKLTYGWAYPAWAYRKPITITEQSGNTLTDYQVAINISYDSDMKSDFSDLRFTWLNETSGNEQEIPYWIESEVDSNWAYVWIKVPEIPANDNATVYMYYGNPDATSESNGTAVFELFDDFDDGDVSDWTTVKNNNDCEVSASTDWSVSGSYSIKVYCPDSNVVGIDIYTYKSLPITDNLAVDVYFHTDNLGRQYGFTLTDDVPDTSSGDEIRWRLVGDQDVWKAEYRIDGSSNVLDTLSEFDTAFLEISKIGNSVRWKINDTTFSTSISVTINKVSFFHSGYPTVGVGTSAYFDNLIVRKFADPEPTYSIGSEETSIQAPEITIYSPTNTTYTTSSIVFNFTVTDAENSTFWVKAYDDGTLIYENTSYANNTLVTIELSKSDGSHYVTVWANDTDASNPQVSEVTVYYTVKTVPYFENLTVEPASPQIYDEQVGINITIDVYDENENLDEVWIEHNFSGTMQNYTMENLTAPNSNPTTYFYNWTQTMTAGNYSFRICANDTASNLNCTDWQNYTIEKGDPSIVLTSSAGWTLQEGQSTTISCSAEIPYTLTFDGVEVSSPYSVQPSLGTHEVKCYVSDTQNYTNTEVTKDLSVNPLIACTNNETFGYEATLDVSAHDVVTLNLTPLVEQKVIRKDLGDVWVNATVIGKNLTNGYYLIVNTTGIDTLLVRYSNYYVRANYSEVATQGSVLSIENPKQINPILQLSVLDEMSGKDLYPPNSTMMVILACSRGENYIIIEDANDTQFNFAGMVNFDKVAVRVKYTADMYYSRQRYLEHKDFLTIPIYVVDAYQNALDRIDFVMKDPDYYNSMLQIYRKIENRSLIISEGYFDADHYFSVYLMEDTDYYIRTVNPDGSTTEFGTITVVQPATKELSRAVISISPQAQLIANSILMNAYTNENRTELYVIYQDKTGETNEVNITIYFENGTIFKQYSYANTSNVDLTIDISDYSNQSFRVVYSISHEIFGNSPVRYQLSLLAPVAFPIGAGSLVMNLISLSLILGVGLITTRESLVAGTVLTLITILFLYAIGWLNTTPVFIIFCVVLGILGIAVYFKQGGE